MGGIEAQQSLARFKSARDHGYTAPFQRARNGEIKRRTEVGGIFLNEAAVRRLVGAILRTE